MAAVVDRGTTDHLLEVRGLRTEFATAEGVVHAVNGVDFYLDKDEILATVGESGCGKSVTMLSLMQLIPVPPGRIVAGEAVFGGQDLLRLPPKQMQRVRGSEISMVFQEPLTSLNPVFTVGDQIGETIRSHESIGQRELDERVHQLIEAVGIPNPERIARSYPHQLSGGMCQRIMLAIAVSCRPRLLIADEPTTALDVTTQAQLLELIRRLQEATHVGVIWVTHDLGIVAGLAHRVQVMYAGRIVETAPVDVIYRDPLHPYTLGLLRCVPRLDEARAERLQAIPGAPPDLINPPAGCPFAPRCTFRSERCDTENPPLELVNSAHARACWASVESLRATRNGPEL